MLILIVLSNKIYLLGAECIRMTLVCHNKQQQTCICPCSCIDKLIAFSLDCKIELAEYQSENETVLWKPLMVHRVQFYLRFNVCACLNEI